VGHSLGEALADEVSLSLSLALALVFHAVFPPFILVMVSDVCVTFSKCLAGKDDSEEAFMDGHYDYGDSERAMRQGQMQNAYGMMPGNMSVPGNFYGQGAMGGMGGMGVGGYMPPGQMGAGMGWQGGRPDQGFRQQSGAPIGRPGAQPQVHLDLFSPLFLYCPKRIFDFVLYRTL
jgi:hypothetical protein